jgi:hypothetical protein
MNKGPIAVTVSLLLSVMLALPPLAISAGQGHGGGGGGRGGAVGHGGGGWGRGGAMGHGGFGGHAGFGGSRGFAGGHRGFGPQHFNHGRPFFNHGFGRFFPFGAFASPVVFWWPSSYGWPYPYGSYGWPYFAGSALYPNDYYGGPGGYAYPPASAPASAAPTVYSVNIYNPAPAAAQPIVQPAVYEPPPVSPGAFAPASPQGVVEYEGGRYELRGDGMTTAYKWVWIPNPPPGPPGASAMRAPAAGDLAPARRGTIYHWVDDQNVLHVTDRWETVPQRYREQAKQNLNS